MTGPPDTGGGDFISRQQIADAIRLLSSIDLHFDQFDRHEFKKTASTPSQANEDDRFFSRKHWTSFLPNLFSGVLGTGCALVLGWYFIGTTYLSEREAAAPVLSIEYAYFAETGSLAKKPISDLVHGLTSYKHYNEFAMQTMGWNDLRTIDAMNDEIGATDAGKILQAANRYATFLAEEQRELSSTLNSLPRKTDAELRLLARLKLDNLDEIEGDNIKARLTDIFQADEREVVTLLDGLSLLKQTLSTLQRRIFVKLSILNTGGRPGLVRPRGYLQYENACYSMVRIEAPPMDEQPLAVPTYVVNSDTGGVTETVGKIDSDTMAQYWFEVRGSVTDSSSCSGLAERLIPNATLAERQPSICPDGQIATVYLFDQRRLSISDEVECSGPIL